MYKLTIEQQNYREITLFHDDILVLVDTMKQLAVTFPSAELSFSIRPIGQEDGEE